MPQQPRTQRLPNFIIIGRVREGELDCISAINGSSIADAQLWNALLIETHRCLSLAVGEDLTVWSVHDITAVLLPDPNAIGFAACIDLSDLS
ncbi:hypothetical protein [Qipengyuania profunda]|uniref:hypothetical protein n=1 Tax=Qipengyuania profunda TaxID=3113984 RepID=UPI002A18E756|nr:hypothetical protein [Qipengyuania sp. HL-TH1]WPL55413.1 hypothetical protein SD421_00370 [Qipengyuania sp. HL-TH5]